MFLKQELTAILHETTILRYVRRFVSLPEVYVENMSGIEDNPHTFVAICNNILFRLDLKKKG